MLHRRGHTALELVVIVGIEQVVLAIVLVVQNCLDAGEAAARRALPLLLSVGLTVRRAQLGAGHDPDSLRLEAGPETVLKMLEDAPDAVAQELDRLVPRGQRFSPQERAEAAEMVDAARPSDRPIA